MSDFSITLQNAADEAEVRAVVQGLIGFNEHHAPPENWRPLVLLAHDAEGALRGGLLGSTHWNWLHVSHLWIDGPARGRGLGRRLLLAAEAEARGRGCRHVHLDTFSFQARRFYESLGYEVFGELADYPPGHSRFFLRKHLGQGQPS
jgi:GNAT superfamily N-acetyltransferase